MPFGVWLVWTKGTCRLGQCRIEVSVSEKCLDSNTGYITWIHIWSYARSNFNIGISVPAAATKIWQTVGRFKKKRLYLMILPLVQSHCAPVYQQQSIAKCWQTDLYGQGNRSPATSRDTVQKESSVVVGTSILLWFRAWVLVKKYVVPDILEPKKNVPADKLNSRFASEWHTSILPLFRHIKK